MNPRHVVKVGGSLFAWTELRPRLRQWLRDNAPPETVLIAGGGAAVDVVRQLDRVHSLGDEVSHSLAIRSMAMNAELLAATIPEACVVDGADLVELAWEQRRLPILDVTAFCEADQSLPHNWSVTSDSIAARFAVCCAASDLILLKSKAPPEVLEDPPAAAWAKCGYVDSYLPRVLDGQSILLHAINLRDG